MEKTMAGQSRKVKTRIVATRKTAQITKAMNMVSASKLKNAENAIKEYRPFIAKTRDIIVHLASNDSSLKHPLMEKRPIKNICYLLHQIEGLQVHLIQMYVKN